MEFSLTTALIGITAITSIVAFNRHEMMDRWMFMPYRIKKRGQWDRFILSGFIHKDYIHLLFNMFTFYFFGRVVEMFLGYTFGEALGGLFFVGFYLLGIVISDIPTYKKHQDDSHYRALGASGGTAAAVFASIVIMPLSDICLFGIICLPGFILGVLFLIYSYAQGKKGGDNINHDAHLYGAIFGIIFILVLSPSSAGTFIEQIRDFRLF
ncbi:rhomboid family intramembrane serine protease [Algoriphagus aestuariicola]|jgi:membrane associated rhomboid family serine protease|uniref:Rhomboid family intramembrane serine protease n=1 Tax=Algoriphagus aestuariicola TaxID=1852016 RepID=A0ABS3BWH5_9BACT|nr:rhomboid family intramembrane serine protease [Algoriphagus aestuariicola]MBN7803653.1 rhomboid family intramembrane serine protease [Algoriphagus aestuariicola]